jgi:peptidoglycan/LPS O-acetylase OafA/YrhL
MHAWLWSICVEEHFYILLCILMTVLIRLRLISLQAFFSAYLFFLVIGLGLRIYNLGYPEFNFFRDYARSHIRFDSLFFGVLLNHMYRRKKLTKWKSPVGVLLALAGVSLSFLFSMDDSRYTRIDTVVLPAINPVCFGYLMIRMLPVRGAWMKPFAYIGKYSYPIYLFHGSVNDFAHRFFTGWEYGLAYFSISLIIGIFISKILEYPLLALRDKWFPGTAPVGL